MPEEMKMRSIQSKSLIYWGGIVLGLLAASPASAAVFNFGWSSAGATPDVAGNSATATGTISINAIPGANFVNGDVTALDITVTTVGPNASVLNFGVADAAFIFGSISGDGSTANFDDFFVVEGAIADPGDIRFGCTEMDCGSGIVFTGDATPLEIEYSYGSQVAAQSSLVATLVPFEFEASIGLLALGALWGGSTYLKKRKAAKIAG
jgi:hypothetical protein